MMWSLLSQIWLCLPIAAAIGFAVAWLLKGRKNVPAIVQPDAEIAFKLRQRDEELAAAHAEITIHNSTLDILRNEIATLTKRISSYEAGNAKRELQEPRQPRIEKGVAVVRGATETRRVKEKERSRGRIQKDDLKLITGIGPVLQRRLNSLGVYSFKQIALWTKEDVDRFAEHMQSFGDRITREHWVRGAKKLHKEKYNETL